MAPPSAVRSLQVADYRRQGENQPHVTTGTCVVCHAAPTARLVTIVTRPRPRPVTAVTSSTCGQLIPNLWINLWKTRNSPGAVRRRRGYCLRGGRKKGGDWGRGCRLAENPEGTSGAVAPNGRNRHRRVVRVSTHPPSGERGGGTVPAADRGRSQIGSVRTILPCRPRDLSRSIQVDGSV